MGFGMMRSVTSQMWMGPWSGPSVPLAEMPAFYRRRLRAMSLSGEGRLGMRAFSDPMLSLGGGLELALARRVFVRPDARALVILGDGDSETIALLSFSFGYRF